MWSSVRAKDLKALHRPVHLTLLGGGSRFGPFRDTISVGRPLGRDFGMTLEPAAAAGDCPVRPVRPSDAPLFAVAHGLSIHPRLVGEVHLPGAVANAVAPAAAADQTPDHVDAGRMAVSP